MSKIEFQNCKCVVEPGKFDINNIPLDCPATYRLFKAGYTVGVFQLERKLGQEWSSRVQPSNIEEIGALTALIRPGCLECISKDTEILLRREKKGNGKYSYKRMTIEDLYHKYNKYMSCKYRGSNLLGILSVHEEDDSFLLTEFSKLLRREEAKLTKSRYKIDIDQILSKMMAGVALR